MKRYFYDNIKIKDLHFSKEDRCNLNEYVINNGLLKEYRNLSISNNLINDLESRKKADYETYDNFEKSSKELLCLPAWVSPENVCFDRYELNNKIKLMNNVHGSLPMKICHCLLDSKWHKKKRLKDKISALLSQPCVFLTITFNDKCLNSTTIDTRRQYVKRYLNTFKRDYIANIDYGKENEREHYHALLQCESIPVGKDCLWVKKERGSVYSLKVINPNASKLSEYIMKFTNHATKATTREIRPIFSKLKN